MKTKTYIVFYKFYEKEIDGIKGKSTEGFGWIDNIQVTRKRKEKFDILELNSRIKYDIINNNNMSVKTEVIITNIIDQIKI